MKRTKLLKKIGTVVLSATLLVSLSVVVFAADASGADFTTNNYSSSSIGSSSGSAVSSSAKKDGYKTLQQWINEQIEQEMYKALSEGRDTVKVDGTLYDINSLSRDIIKELSDYDLNTEFSFDYDGSHYVVTIPAGETPISDDVFWYGPKYLASLYEDTTVITAIE